MRELELEGKSVEHLARGILELEFVGVFVELVNLENLGDNVEVTLLGLSLVEGDVHVVRDHRVRGEVLVGPLSKVLESGGLALLKSGVLAREGEGSELVGSILSGDLLLD